MPSNARSNDGPDADPDGYDVLLRTDPDARARPGRLFLGADSFVVAPSRHRLPTRLFANALGGLLFHLPESLGLYDPHALSRTEATHHPDAVRAYYADVEGLAPFVRPTGFSLHLRLDGREDPLRLAFRSSEEREEAVSLARALRDRARDAGAEPELFDPGGRTRLLSLDD